MNRKRAGLLFVSSITLEADDEPTAQKKWSRLAEDFRVHVLCFSPKGFTHLKKYNCDFYTLPNDFPLVLRVGLYYMLFPPLIIYLTFKKNLEVWVAQSPYEAGAILIPKLFFFFSNKRKLIIEAHGDWIESFFELRTVPLSFFFKKLIVNYSKIILKLADGLRSISVGTKQLLNKYAPQGLPHETFPTYMNLDQYLSTSLKEKEDMENSKLLYIGALTQLKGLDILIKAFSEIQSTTSLNLTLVGEGPYRNQLEQMINSKELDEEIQFTGYLYPKKLRKQILKSECLVLPSRTEGFGRVLIESLACFTPFIATNTKGPTELAKKSQGGTIVPIDDAQKLAEEIERFHNSKELRRKYATRGRNFVEGNYSSDKYFESYTNLIHKVSINN